MLFGDIKWKRQSVRSNCEMIISLFNQRYIFVCYMSGSKRRIQGTHMMLMLNERNQYMNLIVNESIESQTIKYNINQSIIFEKIVIGSLHSVVDRTVEFQCRWTPNSARGQKTVAALLNVREILTVKLQMSKAESEILYIILFYCNIFIKFYRR